MSNSPEAPQPTVDIPVAEQDQHLCEWLDACTILRCSASARTFLARRGRKFFRTFAESLHAADVISDILYQEYAGDQSSTEPNTYISDAVDEADMQACKKTGAPSNDASDSTPDPVNPRTRATGPSFLRERPWMLFETHMCVPGATGRKPFKDLLMAIAKDNPGNMPRRVGSVMAYIKNCFRVVVRTWIAREANEIRNSDGLIIRRTVSETTARDPGDKSSSGSVYDQISRIGQEGGQPIGLHVIEIHDYLPAELPDPVETAQRSQLQTMAADIADDVKPELAHAMRVALAARYCGVSLAHPEVVKFAKRGHTQLSVYLQSPEPGQELPVKSNLPSMINMHIRERFPDLEPGAIPALRATVLQFLIEDNENWLHQPENDGLLGFLQAEEQKTL